MGYFLHKFGIKPFVEAEVDGQNLDDNQPTDYTDAPPEDNTQPQTNDQNQEVQNQNPDMQNDNDTPQEDMTTDYTEEDSQAGGTYDDSEQISDNTGGEEEQPVDDIKQQEEELYSNLSPTLLDIKHRELKNQFLNMYDIVSSIIERIGDADISEDNIGIVEYVSDNLSRMRNMLTDYIESVYAAKSYIENSVNYNRFLAVLNGINEILEQVEKKGR